MLLIFVTTKKLGHKFGGINNAPTSESLHGCHVYE